MVGLSGPKRLGRKLAFSSRAGWQCARLVSTVSWGFAIDGVGKPARLGRKGVHLAVGVVPVAQWVSGRGKKRQPGFLVQVLG